MIHVKYKLDVSNKHGVGLFAAEPITKGRIIYTESPLLDVNLTQEQFESLSELEQQEVRWWGFLDPQTNKWHVDFDVTHFVNHATPGTITQDTAHAEPYLIAARDVALGEELTQNYLEFESLEDVRARGITI